MPRPIPPSDLIVRPDGRLYHLGLRPQDLADLILTVGDPERVGQVSRYFDKVTFRQQQREFVTHTGTLRGQRLTVISSGMGTDNVEILMTELDALANVDLATRTEVPTPRSLRVVRLGTSGSVHPDVPLGSLVCTQYAVGLDTLMQFYPLSQSDLERALGEGLQAHLGLDFTPYGVVVSENLQAQLAADFRPGLTLTCPGFYAPQGRWVRIRPRQADWLARLGTFAHEGWVPTNLEMETAGYYAMGRLLGHEVLSLNAIVADRVHERFASDPDAVVDTLIRTVLDRL